MNDFFSEILILCLILVQKIFWAEDKFIIILFILRLTQIFLFFSSLSHQVSYVWMTRKILQYWHCPSVSCRRGSLETCSCQHNVTEIPRWVLVQGLVRKWLKLCPVRQVLQEWKSLESSDFVLENRVSHVWKTWKMIEYSEPKIIGTKCLLFA